MLDFLPKKRRFFMVRIESTAQINTTHSPEVTNASAEGCTVTKIALHALRALCLGLLAAGVGGVSRPGL